jgi:hypothetical protein
VKSRGTDVAIRIQPYTEEFTSAVAEFNRRMIPAGASFQVPETPVSPWLPNINSRNIFQKIYLAVEDRCVRGAYTFKQQPFSFGGRILSVGACQMPISEGILDKRYSLVGPRLVHDALRKQPLLYGLGMGSREAAVARVLGAMGWSLRTVPFFFKVRNGFRFLRNIQHLRITRFRRVLLDIAAYSGAGSLGTTIARALLTGKQRVEPVSAQPVSEFSAWADDLWQACKNLYSMVGVRDAEVLNILYPPDNPRFIRLKVLQGHRVAGWAVLLDTAMCGDKYFGNMRVGSIVDCLAAPGDAGPVMAAAARFLERRDVDLLLSNQSHPAWGRGLTNAGFVEGPSNFFFTSSPQLTQLLDEADPARTGIHLNRGDGDGPIHL